MMRSASQLWTNAEDLKAQLLKLWQRGELLRAFVGGDPEFPLRLKFKGPTAREVTDHFEAVRAWAASVQENANIRVELREVSHRVHGLNALPNKVWIDHVGDALALIGKQRVAADFACLYAELGTRLPALQSWALSHPHDLLALGDHAHRLMDVVEWLQMHPRADVFLRQVDLPGIDSKFIEAHRRILSRWFDAVLPAEAIDQTHTGISGFAPRYGFREKPVRIRMRLLDDAINPLPELGYADLTLDAASFAKLSITPERVFITENEVNFLAFPHVQRSIVLFGAGYGWAGLAQALWLQACELYYWGDIDTHGFAILDSLRKHFPHVQSLLMNEATLLSHEQFWGIEETQVKHDLLRLTPAESTMYDTLRWGHIRNGLRLEQERIGFGHLEEALRGLD